MLNFIINISGKKLKKYLEKLVEKLTEENLIDRLKITELVDIEELSLWIEVELSCLYSNN